ncbi:hypothetical protein MSG28_008607 [Choristoneura fumiferana]|uniref:Uncharacterized protein n=1 Tax=Choristoneura fumiferana TaxID=7141 RepID=A0ACC0J7C8_CHOFU|nr:hypothetical protein MSG28_008607 [Choristoneura fumiferana]
MRERLVVAAQRLPALAGVAARALHDLEAPAQLAQHALHAGALRRHALDILSRSKPATDSRTSTGSSSAKRHVPELEDFILKRDYTGALTMLENEGNTEVWADAWAAWSWFHLGEYRRALDAYMRVRGRANLDARVADTLDMDLAVCYFYLDVTVNNILLYRTCMHDSDSNYTKEDCNGFLLPDKTNATHMLEEDVQKHIRAVPTLYCTYFDIASNELTRIA